jgi:hypothetical protein
MEIENEGVGIETIRVVTGLPSRGFNREWYDEGNADNFWMQWRKRVLQRTLSRYRVPTGDVLRVLDIGGGRGVLRDQLEACTSWRIDIAETNHDALRRCEPGRGQLIYYDVQEGL